MMRRYPSDDLYGYGYSIARMMHRFPSDAARYRRSAVRVLRTFPKLASLARLPGRLQGRDHVPTDVRRMTRRCALCGATGVLQHVNGTTVCVRLSCQREARDIRHLTLVRSRSSRYVENTFTLCGKNLHAPRNEISRYVEKERHSKG